MLEKDDALAAETASKEDEDSAGLKSSAGFGGMDGFTDLMRQVISSCFSDEIDTVVARVLLVQSDRILIGFDTRPPTAILVSKQIPRRTETASMV